MSGPPGPGSLRALCAGVLDLDRPEAGAVAAELARFLDHLPGTARTAFRGGLAVLEVRALARHRRPLGRLSRAQAESLVASVAAGSRGRELVEGLKVPVLLAHGARSARPREHGGSGPARPDADLHVVVSGDWPSRSVTQAVVVGSGAGGAMAARTLARAGLDVVVVEEGRRFTVEEFRTRPPLERFTELYRDAGATVALGRPPVILPVGRGVGGTTLVNSGTCYRTPEPVLARWRDVHGVGLADPEGFAAHLDRVEELLRVAPVPEDVMGRNGRLALAGARALGWSAGPLVRNAPGCAGSCECAVGCPRNAKFGVHLNALPDACAAGARIVSRARVERLLHAGGRVAGVRAVRSDGSVLEILAPLVVVAAGATETPALLHRSGLGGHPQLGRNLAVHPAVSAAGWFHEPVHATRGVLQSAAVDEFHRSRGILVEATATPPGMGSMVLPGTGRALTAQLDRADHLATLGAMIADRPSGRVLGRRRSVVRYDLAPGDAARLVEAVGIMGRLLFAAGATAVVTGIPGHDTVRDARELDAALEAARPGHLHVAAFHPTGTARMGADPADHPVDAEGRLRGVAGVWVADASALPTCPEVNPQVTIMALAQAVAECALREATGVPRR